jgi:hypothetical protein
LRSFNRAVGQAGTEFLGFAPEIGILKLLD